MPPSTGSTSFFVASVPMRLLKKFATLSSSAVPLFRKGSVAKRHFPFRLNQEAPKISLSPPTGTTFPSWNRKRFLLRAVAFMTLSSRPKWTKKCSKSSDIAQLFVPISRVWPPTSIELRQPPNWGAASNNKNSWPCSCALNAAPIPEIPPPKMSNGTWVISSTRWSTSRAMPTNRRGRSYTQ